MEENPEPHLVTEWLAGWQQGDDHARDQLFSAVYPQLRRVASRFLQQERADHTLEPSALVNEVALRLLGSGPIAYNDRTHFFALAAQMMRRILIDHARTGAAAKRGGVQQRVNLSSIPRRTAPQKCRTSRRAATRSSAARRSK